MFGNSTSSYVVCLHGINRNRRDFDYLSVSLSERHTVITIDMFGRGDSDWFNDKNKYNYASYYHGVLKLLNSLGIEKVKLVGTSMGGIIGMYLASAQPNLVSSLVLNDIGPYISLDVLKKLVYYINDYRAFHSRADAEVYMRKFLSPLKLSEDKLSHTVKNSLRLSDDGCYYLNYDPAIGLKLGSDVQSMSEGMNLWHVWRKLNQSVLILRGQESEVLTISVVQKMMSGRNNIKCIEYEGLGHCPSLMEDNQISDVEQWVNTT